MDAEEENILHEEVRLGHILVKNDDESEKSELRAAAGIEEKKEDADVKELTLSKTQQEETSDLPSLDVTQRLKKPKKNSSGPQPVSKKAGSRHRRRSNSGARYRPAPRHRKKGSKGHPKKKKKVADDGEMELDDTQSLPLLPGRADEARPIDTTLNNAQNEAIAACHKKLHIEYEPVRQAIKVKLL